MRVLLVALVALIVISPALHAAAPSSAEELRAAFEGAFSKKEKATLEALYYAEGLSDSDKELNSRMLDMFWQGPGEVESVTIVPVPEEITKPRIARGKKWEVALPPSGAFQVNFKGSSGQWQRSTMTVLFGESAGKYYLVPAKSTDLGWKGPEDTTLTYMVIGEGQEKVKIRYRWNVSGVDLEEIAKSPSLSFVGQYIESVTVTSDSDDTNVTLTIREHNKDIYTSQPLKGKGTLEYKRP